MVVGQNLFKKGRRGIPTYPMCCVLTRKVNIIWRVLAWWCYPKLDPTLVRNVVRVLGELVRPNFELTTHVMCILMAGVDYMHGCRSRWMSCPLWIWARIMMYFPIAVCPNSLPFQQGKWGYEQWMMPEYLICFSRLKSDALSWSILISLFKWPSNGGSKSYLTPLSSPVQVV